MNTSFTKKLLEAHITLAEGGRDNGAPGYRGEGHAYYAAFVIDPDGNNIEAAFRVPAGR